MCLGNIGGQLNIAWTLEQGACGEIPHLREGLMGFHKNVVLLVMSKETLILSQSLTLKRVLVFPLRVHKNNLVLRS